MESPLQIYKGVDKWHDTMKEIRWHTYGDTELLKFPSAKTQAKLKAIEEWWKIWFPKIELNAYTCSLPSGYSCPFAHDCKSKADRVTGKITDGKHTEFRCYSASLEAMYPTVRDMTWHNFDLLRKMDTEEMVSVIHESVAEDMTLMRVHQNGDFFNAKYFNAWMQVASLYPNKIFYAYTKSLRYWLECPEIPSNFKLTASRGGRDDALIDEFNLKCAEVVFSPEEAERKGLEVDTDEWHAIVGEESFALWVHGTQPKGSKGAEGKKLLKELGVKHEYTRK